MKKPRSGWGRRCGPHGQPSPGTRGQLSTARRAARLARVFSARQRRSAGSTEKKLKTRGTRAPRGFCGNVFIAAAERRPHVSSRRRHVSSRRPHRSEDRSVSEFAGTRQKPCHPSVLNTSGRTFGLPKEEPFVVWASGSLQDMFVRSHPTPPSRREAPNPYPGFLQSHESVPNVLDESRGLDKKKSMVSSLGQKPRTRERGKGGKECCIQRGNIRLCWHLPS